MKRLIKFSKKRPANENQATGERQTKIIEGNVTLAVEYLLDALEIDWRNDHNTRNTPQRVAKMYVREIFAGRYAPMPSITDFPNVSDLDNVYAVGPVTVRSTCSHHLQPFIGEAWIGILPTDRVIGLSKFSRLTDWIMSRPQIQEEATVQLVDVIDEAIKPRGVAVVVRAQHFCMVCRGVKEADTRMVTSVMRGEFRVNDALRNEFMGLIKGMGF